MLAKMGRNRDLTIGALLLCCTFSDPKSSHWTSSEAVSFPNSRSQQVELDLDVARLFPYTVGNQSGLSRVDKEEIFHQWQDRNINFWDNLLRPGRNKAVSSWNSKRRRKKDVMLSMESYWNASNYDVIQRGRGSQDLAGKLVSQEKMAEALNKEKELKGSNNNISEESSYRELLLMKEDKNETKLNKDYADVRTERKNGYETAIEENKRHIRHFGKKVGHREIKRNSLNLNILSEFPNAKEFTENKAGQKQEWNFSPFSNRDRIPPSLTPEARVLSKEILGKWVSYQPQPAQGVELESESNESDSLESEDAESDESKLSGKSDDSEATSPNSGSEEDHNLITYRKPTSSRRAKNRTSGNQLVNDPGQKVFTPEGSEVESRFYGDDSNGIYVFKDEGSIKQRHVSSDENKHRERSKHEDKYPDFVAFSNKTTNNIEHTSIQPSFMNRGVDYISALVAKGEAKETEAEGDFELYRPLSKKGKNLLRTTSEEALLLAIPLSLLLTLIILIFAACCCYKHRQLPLFPHQEKANLELLGYDDELRPPNQDQECYLECCGCRFVESCCLPDLSYQLHRVKWVKRNSLYDNDAFEDPELPLEEKADVVGKPPLYALLSNLPPKKRRASICNREPGDRKTNLRKSKSDEFLCV